MDFRKAPVSWLVVLAAGFTLRCAEACPEGYERELDQCVLRTSESEHRCSVLPTTKPSPDGRGVMTRVDIVGRDCIWIDQTEVTVEAYKRWLEEAPDGPAEYETTFCSWKKARTDPTLDGDPCVDALPSGDSFSDQKPIRCVDFCDAVAYCQFAGKHLCYGGGSSANYSPTKVAREWLLACTNGLETAYPWGNAPEEGICNTNIVPQSAHEPGFEPGCVNARGVMDLIGNVAEWSHACLQPTREGMPSNCIVRGGGFTEPMTSCAAEPSRPGNTRWPDVGFRCCADLTDEEELILSQSGGRSAM